MKLFRFRWFYKDFVANHISIQFAGEDGFIENPFAEMLAAGEETYFAQPIEWKGGRTGSL